MSKQRVSQYLPQLILFTGLLLTAVIAITSAMGTRDRNRLRFEREVDSAHAAIQSRFELYIAVLRGGSALFAAHPAVDGDMFRSFVNRLDIPKRYPGAQGIGFSIRLGDTKVFAVPGGQESLRVWPETPRTEHHAIVYLEPLDRRNRAALGYDMFSETTRREAMERARDSAAAAASGKVTLVQEIDDKKQAGFLIFVPVYRSASVPQTVAERRQLLDGFVYAPFRIEDTLRAIFPSDYHRFLHIDVFDGHGADERRRLYRSGDTFNGSHQAVRHLQLPARTWTIRYAAQSGFVQQNEHNEIPWIILIGAGTSLLLAWAVRGEASARRTAEVAASVLSEQTVELRSAYEEANRSERRYRQILDTSQEAIWVTDAHAVTIFVNEATARLMGCDASEMMGRPIAEFLDQDTAAALQQRFEFPKGARGERSELRMGRRDGTTLCVRVSATSLRDDDDTYVGTLAMLTDLTSQRIAEEERDELYQRLEGVLESIGEGLIVFDLSLSCTRMNQSAAQLLNVHPDAAMGQDVHRLLHGSCESQGTCALWKTLLSGGVAHGDDVFTAGPGQSFSSEYAVSPIIADGSATGFVLTFRDVTEQRFLRLQLEQAQRLSSLGGLAASIAHEFNNVLMMIQPFADLIARHDLSAERTTRAHEQITSAIHRGKRTTEEILAFTRDASPRLDPIDVRSYVERLLAQIRPSLPDLFLEAEVRAEGLWMAGDSAQLDQVFSNLLINARDAGATRILLTVDECGTGKTSFPTGAVAAPERFVHFSVVDDGVGMSEEVMERAFEPLFTTKRNGGTGLGLPIAQRIVLKHGGMIAVCSEQGKTRFDLLLRREIAPAVLAPREEHLTPMEPNRVLMVDDELSIVEGVSLLLELEGHRVRTVSTGAAALAAISEFEPDLLVLDVGLPDIDGRQLYDGIQKVWPDLPVIFSTGHAQLGGPGRPFLLRKPYEFKDLLKAMVTVLSSAPGGSRVCATRVLAQADC